MGFAIVVDSTCDMSPQELEDMDVTMIALTIDIDSASYLDQVEISSPEFYERMAAAASLPKTACPKPYDFMELYKQKIAQGYDGVLVLNIAETLSGTVQSARLAAKDVDASIEVIDTMGATMQSFLVIQKAVECRDAGMSLEQTASIARDFIGCTKFLIACDTLENLLKGGRLAQEDAAAATKLNIKPILTFDEAGRIKPFDKARGMNGARKSIVAALKAEQEKIGRLRIRFGHANNPAEAAKLKAAVDEAGVDYIDCGTCLCGATIGSHLGPGALGAACASA